LSYRPLKIVWADQPTAVRFRVNKYETDESTALLHLNVLIEGGTKISYYSPFKSNIETVITSPDNSNSNSSANSKPIFQQSRALISPLGYKL
jgi:hypothetical protein